MACLVKSKTPGVEDLQNQIAKRCCLTGKVDLLQASIFKLMSNLSPEQINQFMLLTEGCEQLNGKGVINILDKLTTKNGAEHR
jgi:RecJ-like exonuclease